MKTLYYLLLSITIISGCTYRQPIGTKWRPVTTHTIAAFTQDTASGVFTTTDQVPLSLQELSYLMPNIEKEGAFSVFDLTTSPPIERINYIIPPIAPLSNTVPTIGFPVEVNLTSTTDTVDPFVSLPFSSTFYPVGPSNQAIDYYNWLYFNEGTVAIDSPEGNIFYNGVLQAMMYQPGNVPVRVIGIPFTTDIPIIGYCSSSGIWIDASPSYPYCPQNYNRWLIWSNNPNSYLDKIYPFYATYEFTDSSTFNSMNTETFTYGSFDMSSMDRTKVTLPPMVKLAVSDNDIIYFAIKNIIYQTSLQGNDITITAVLPVSEEVVSMKTDNNSGLLYVATEHMEYARDLPNFSRTTLNPDLPIIPITGYLWQIDPTQHSITLLAGGYKSYGNTASTITEQTIVPYDIAIDSTGRYLFFINGLPPIPSAIGSYINVLDLKEHKIYLVNALYDKPGSSNYSLNDHYMNLYFTSTATTATLYASIQGLDVNTPEYKSFTGTTLPVYSIETISWPLP